MQINSIKELLKKELENYKQNPNSYKPYMQSMKDISVWVKEKEK
ncbi:MAG: hypothetical protein ABGW74_05195 [Campylobacterales bacterium]